jgi:hypothetical protein
VRKVPPKPLDRDTAKHLVAELRNHRNRALLSPEHLKSGTVQGTAGREIIMSDYDPKRRDPQRPAVNEAGYAADRGFNWSWIIGGIAAIVVLFVALSFVGRDDRTAVDTTPPPVTTGQSAPAERSPAATPAPNAAPTAPAPAEPTAPQRPASPNQ